jgi:hypothetical protein
VRAVSCALCMKSLQWACHIRTMSICWSVGVHVSFDKSFLRVTAVFEALDVNKDLRDSVPVTGLQMVCSATWYTEFTKACFTFILSRCHGVHLNVIFVRPKDTSELMSADFRDACEYQAALYADMLFQILPTSYIDVSSVRIPSTPLGEVRLSLRFSRSSQ